jgi:hypothetical protein
MSLGPVFECPNGLDTRIPEIAHSNGIKVEVLDRPQPNGFARRYVFRMRFGRIEGHRRFLENVSLIWLVFPRQDIFNPLFSVADFGLTRRLGKLLCESGAHPCAWDF